MTETRTIGRTLPHSIEAEEYLLSCCLLDGALVIGRCREFGITPECFFEPKHQILLRCIYDLSDAGRSTEIDTVAEELRTRRELDKIGGSFLAQISSRVPTTAQVGYFVEKVREQALLRDIIRTATGVVEDCYNFTGGIDEFVDQTERKMFAVTQHRIADRSRTVRELATATLGTLNNMMTRRGQLTGAASGFKDLDALTWGFQRTDLIILAARPSMGKTALALNIAETIALSTKGERGHVLIFSLEMAALQLMQRLVCSRARVNMKLLRDGFLSRNGEESQRLMIAGEEIANAPLTIDDSSGIPVSYIRAKSRRIHQRSPLAFIVVDYLQLIAAGDSRTPREQQVAEASRGLKALAKELNVPVMVLSQLNRGADEDGRPRLSHLRESGAIEQDADVVLMLARPKDADDQFQVAADSADLIVAKQRNGPVGTVKLTFLRDITRFENFHR